MKHRATGYGQRSGKSVCPKSGSNWPNFEKKYYILLYKKSVHYGSPGEILSEKILDFFQF